MVREDTPPSTPLNLRDIMDDDFDEEDFVEIAMEDLEQISDEDSNHEGGESDDDSEPADYVDNAKIVFKEHGGSVFCCNIDPKEGRYAITGGEDDKAYVWDTNDGSTQFIGRDFKDSVIGVEFNFDGKMVAAGDMSGVVKVWKLINNSGVSFHEIWSEYVEDILWLKWHNKANVLLSGVSSGEVYMWKIPSGECKLLSGNGFPTDVGYFMPDGKRAVIGYKDGEIKMFDLSTCAVNFSLRNPELGSILCLGVHPENNLVAAGTLNSKVAVFTTQPSKLLSLFTCEDEITNEEGESDTSVETVAFCKDPSLPFLGIATVASINIWDYSKQTFRHKFMVQEGVTKLLWGVPNHLVYIGTQSGDVRVIDARSGNNISEFKGHKSAILDMVLYSDGKKLVTASDDKTARLFSLEQTTPSSET